MHSLYKRYHVMQELRTFTNLETKKLFDFSGYKIFIRGAEFESWLSFVIFVVNLMIDDEDIFREDMANNYRKLRVKAANLPAAAKRKFRWTLPGILFMVYSSPRFTFQLVLLCLTSLFHAIALACSALLAKFYNFCEKLRFLVMRRMLWLVLW